MMYSSAVFESPEQSLYEAQKSKIKLLADKLHLKPGAKVLEIGSGWGAMAIYLAKERQCEVTTVTLSKEQKTLCEQRFRKEDVEDKIEILLKDYRDLEGTFDAIIAVGVGITAIGANNTLATPPQTSRIYTLVMTDDTDGAETYDLY